MLKFLKKKETFPSSFSEDELQRLQTLPYGVEADIQLKGKPFHFHDARCFYDSYQEIIVNEIYKFKTDSKTPYIIDCGANMGLSVLFFSKTYENAEIIAFEPEQPIYDVLIKNIENFGLKNTKAIKKAAWNSETTLEFFTDKGMGGSVENVFQNQKPTIVETVRLRDYLNKRVDLLKLDIEGAEYTVLDDCRDVIKNVENIFVEYHSYINKEQHLEDILTMLKENGFRYHLRQSFSREKPFVDKYLACENMDMAINIFGYKENR
jgi:FkbM family methyltransferase